MNYTTRLYSKSFLCAIVLMLGASSAFAAGLQKITDIGGGNGGGTNNASTIYFGNYWQNGSGTDLSGYAKEGIKWRVLENGSGKTLLLSDKALYADQFNGTAPLNNVWNNSEIQATLNNTTQGNGFAGDAFSANELAAITPTTHNAGGSCEGNDISSTDKLFLLSKDEALESSYGFNDNNARKASATDMAKNVEMYGNSGVATYDFWWLRSPGAPNTLPQEKVIMPTGDTSVASPVDSTFIAVRPALNLNQTNVLFLSAATGGKGAVAVGDGFALDNSYDGSNGWKLTLTDASIATPTITSATVVSGWNVNDLAASAVIGDRQLPIIGSEQVEGENLSVSYTGAATGTNKYVSALLYDSTGTNILNYAKIASAATSAAGTDIKIDLSSVTPGEYKVRFFGEEANGDYQTDYASWLTSANDISVTGAGGVITTLLQTYANSGLTANLSGNGQLGFESGSYDTTIKVPDNQTGKITADFSSGTTLTGNIFIGSGATLATKNGFTLKGDVNGTGVIDNHGTLTLDNISVNTSIIDSDTTSNSTIRINNGSTVRMAGSLQQDNIMVLPGSTLKLSGATVAASSTNPLAASVFTLGNSTLNLQNNSTGTVHLGEIRLVGSNSLMLDADLANGKMDQLKGTGSSDTGTLNISSIKLLSDAAGNTLSLSLFADDTTKTALKDKVTGNLTGLQYSPTYTYDALYDSANGLITFTRQNSGGSDDYNPYLYAPSAMAHLTAATAEHIASLAMAELDVAADTGKEDASLAENENKSANSHAWLKVTGFSDDVKFKHFQTVDSRILNTAFGFNTDTEHIGEMDASMGVYAGALDGKHKYARSTIEQEGGYVGLSARLAGDNAFLTATVNGGLLKNKDRNMYGTDHYDTRWLGLGLKSGYDIALAESCTLQPNLYAGYTFVNTEDYTSDSSVKVSTDDLHLFQIAPGLKLSHEMNNGWRGYFQAKYVVILDNGGKTDASRVNLPGISTKNYLEYGLGVDKALTAAWSLGLELNRRNAGRTGWSGSAKVSYHF